jgi:sugar/nucleoside kinase (ribokinase family)
MCNKNATCASAAGTLRGGRAATVISRVGDDELGREVLRRLKGRGLDTAVGLYNF